jgi:RNA polymerase sigma-70 factor (ECF subfamily)
MMAENRTERLVTLISVNRDDLFRYVYSLLPHEEDARDVLQETFMAIAGKFDEYDPSRPFLPWACRFAYFEVLKHRDRQPHGIVYFAGDVLELLARDREEQEPVLQARLVALEECLAKLPGADRELLRSRYYARVPVEEIATRLKQSRRTLFRNLERVRRWLYECVDRHCVLGEG